MNETMRTTIYVALAVVSMVVVSASGPSVPKSPKEFSEVGKSFYPDFVDANAAKSLRVVTYNAESASVRVFGVEQGPDGVWRIPTRNNYPVDGKDRLAKSATSIIGIKRESLAGQRKAQHAEFGVLDPLGDSVTDFKGVGNRLTMKDKDGKPLVDLIIGKEVKGRPGYFYVRNPKEDQVFAAKVSLDVSTKFTDWIESDLLKLDGSKLRSIVIEKHSVDVGEDRRVVLKGKESNTLTRGNAAGDKWKLEEINEETEEVNEDEVRKLVQALDDLKIIGVRPKSEKLKKSLQDENALAIDQRIGLELQDMGYYILPLGKRRAPTLVSQEGDLNATTEQGVVYDLRFGTTFSGTEEEVEAGFINADGEPKADAKKPESKDDAHSKKINSRYLFVQAFFNSDALGPKPVEPEKPEPPAEDAKPDGDQTPGADPKKAYDAAMAIYQTDLKKYETDLKAYEEKAKAGEKQVKDLNRRFADWYYVISGDSFENLRQGRKTLIKAKTPAANNPSDPKTDAKPDQPSDEKPDQDEKPEPEKPQDGDASK